MMNNEFWEKVFKAAKIIGVPMATARVWRTRKRVPHSRAIELYEALKGSPDEIPLEKFKSVRAQ